MLASAHLSLRCNPYHRQGAWIVLLALHLSAIGNPAPTIQWEVSTNGTDWTAIEDATSSTLTFVAALADNGKQYRAVWTNTEGSVTSSIAILTVNAEIIASIEAVDTELCQGENVQLRLSNTTTGQPPYSVVVNGITYSVSSVGAVFATIVLAEYHPTETYNLTSVTDNNLCIITGAPVSSVIVMVNPAPSGTITPVRTSVYEGEDYDLVFNATSGTGPFDLVINGADYTEKISGTPFSAVPGSYPTVNIWPETTVGGTQSVDNAPIEMGLRFRSSVSGTH